MTTQIAKPKEAVKTIPTTSKLEEFMNSNKDLINIIDSKNSSKLSNYVDKIKLSDSTQEQKPQKGKTRLIKYITTGLIGGAIIFGGFSRYSYNQSQKLTFDQQEGVVFSGADFKSLSVNVTAVVQKTNENYEASYLLNGLTKSSGWFQVGLDNKKLQGNSEFSLVIDIFPNSSVQSGKSIDIVNTLIPFSKTIQPSDIVQLKMSTDGNKVILTGTDLNNGATASYVYSGDKNIGNFIGTLKNGNFTGIMTEIYHSGKSMEIHETPTTYNYSNIKQAVSYHSYPTFTLVPFSDVYRVSGSTYNNILKENEFKDIPYVNFEKGKLITGNNLEQTFNFSTQAITFGVEKVTTTSLSNFQ